MTLENGARLCGWRRHLGVCAGIALLLVGSLPTRAMAGDVPQLLTQKRCNACHDVSTTLLGPPYVAIAVRHRASKDSMVEVLARKIVLGGGGAWGVVPMVPNEHVTLEEARAMAEWILALNPPT